MWNVICRAARGQEALQPKSALRRARPVQPVPLFQRTLTTLRRGIRFLLHFVLCEAFFFFFPAPPFPVPPPITAPGGAMSEYTLSRGRVCWESLLADLFQRIKPLFHKRAAREWLQLWEKPSWLCVLFANGTRSPGPRLLVLVIGVLRPKE